MSHGADMGGFGKFVPGFDFLQKLAQGGAASMASWIAPTMDAQALDKRIEELKAVQFWLDQNAAALKATLQALEVQKMTLATLQSMNASIAKAAPAKQASAASPSGPAAQSANPEAAPAPGAMPDPMQFWNALTTQFQQIAAQAMNDVTKRTGAAGAPTPAPEKKPPRKTAPRRRGKT